MDADTKITVLKRIAARFNEAGITWALGASMLLYFKRIAPEFHDIDLMVADDDAERARQLLCEMGTLLPPSPNDKYRTKCFMEFVPAFGSQLCDADTRCIVDDQIGLSDHSCAFYQLLPLHISQITCTKVLGIHPGLQGEKTVHKLFLTHFQAEYSYCLIQLKSHMLGNI